AVGLRARDPPFARAHERPRNRALLHALHVPARSDALPDHHDAHLLPIHLRRDADRAAHAALLDQHGLGGDHDARWFDLAPRRGQLASAARASPVFAWLHALLLDHGDLVDPSPDFARNLAPRAQTVSVQV